MDERLGQPGTKRESLNEPTIGTSPTMDMTSVKPVRELLIRLAVRPITAPSRPPRRNADRSRSWRAKTRCVISSQRAFSSRESSAASFISFATCSRLLSGESWAAAAASFSASASKSVTATPKIFSSFRVSSFIAPPPARHSRKRHVNSEPR